MQTCVYARRGANSIYELPTMVRKCVCGGGEVDADMYIAGVWPTVLGAAGLGATCGAFFATLVKWLPLLSF